MCVDCLNEKNKLPNNFRFFPLALSKALAGFLGVVFVFPFPTKKENQKQEGITEFVIILDYVVSAQPVPT